MTDQPPLQALASTPREALAALRCYAGNYERLCHVKVPVSLSTPTVFPEPFDGCLASDYQSLIAASRIRKVFWREASKLAKAAVCYRSAQAARSNTEHH